MERYSVTSSAGATPGRIASDITSYQRHPYIEQDNAVSFKIYRDLKQTVQECQPHAAPNLNLAEVFLKDLMIILTGYALRIREVDSPYRPQTAEEWKPQGRLPYIDFSDVENGIDPDSKVYGAVESAERTVLQRVSKVSRMVGPMVGARNTVAIGKPSALDLRELISSLLRSRTKISFPAAIPLAIPNRTEQFKHLEVCVQNVCERLERGNSAPAVFRVVQRHVQSLTIEKDPQPFNFEALVVGSRGVSANRLLAARAGAAGVPVIGVSHGGGDGMYDEPMYGLDEKSFATSVLGFGPAGGQLLDDADFTESLHGVPEYTESDDPQVRSLYGTSEIPALATLDGKKIFYVPTSFLGAGRCGPFRDIPDRMYLQWQETLLREFPEAVWKGYPNDFSSHKSVPVGAKTISRLPLQECLGEADVFIFDYLSTAFCLAAATDKPIIYFDIGLRNPSKIGLKGIQDRCIYLQADPEYAANLKELVVSRTQEPRYNTFTSRVSLATTPPIQSRTQIAVNLLKGTLR